MNLYYLHKSLIGSTDIDRIVPFLAYKTAVRAGRTGIKALRVSDADDVAKLERTIARDPQFAYYYAHDILERRFPEGEAAIAKNSYYAFRYALRVIKGRWPEGETAIARSPEYAFYYASEVIKDRFPEGEEAILNSVYAYSYRRFMQ